MITTQHKGFQAASVQAQGMIRLEAPGNIIVADPKELLGALKLHAPDLFDGGWRK